MADLKSDMPTLYLRDEELRKGIELLYFAYRDHNGVPDQILAEYGFGRAHHRAIHFIARRPGLSVSDLIGILKITKQSLSRVLSALVAEGYVHLETGTQDRRQRLLTLTEKGNGLERKLAAVQRERIARAYREAGAEAVAGFWKVLLGLIDAEHRADIKAFVDKS